MTPSERLIKIVQLISAVNREMGELGDQADVMLVSQNGRLRLDAHYPLKVISEL